MPGDNTRPHDAWPRARLIPVAGIRGQEEQERRATSALLAVIGAVPEFARALLTDLRAPRGSVSTYTEIQFKDADGKVSIPDGAIVVERGTLLERDVRRRASTGCFDSCRRRRRAFA
jgi:hypothetical protein